MENKTGKYFKYAIGEIVLVVIGILIALQINTWNEQKKERSFEVKMLNEVRKELIKDTIYLNMIKGRAKYGFLGSKKMLQYYGQKGGDIDSIYKYGIKMHTSFLFTYHKGAYEAIKSTGIDKISNDSVRITLTDLYDFSFLRTEKFIEGNQAVNGDNFYDDLEPFITFSTKETLNGEFTGDFSPKLDFYKNPKNLKRILTNISLKENSIFRLNSLIKDCEFLLQLLDKELDIKDIQENIPQNNWQSND